MCLHIKVQSVKEKVNYTEITISSPMDAFDEGPLFYSPPALSDPSTSPKSSVIEVSRYQHRVNRTADV
jgi:hypothetical protein